MCKEQEKYIYKSFYSIAVTLILYLILAASVFLKSLSGLSMRKVIGAIANLNLSFLKMGFYNLRDSGSVPWTILNFGGKSPAYYLLSKTNNK